MYVHKIIISGRQPWPPSCFIFQDTCTPKQRSLEKAHEICKNKLTWYMIIRPASISPSGAPHFTTSSISSAANKGNHPCKCHWDLVTINEEIHDRSWWPNERLSWQHSSGILARPQKATPARPCWCYHRPQQLVSHRRSQQGCDHRR